jgi:hypothetical protein
MSRPDFVADALAAWVNRGYDRDRASNGRSRYESYLLDRAESFADLDPDDPDFAAGDRLRFACQAWAIANGPIMSPGLVETHPRILGVQAAPDTWDMRHLLLEVTLVSPQPAVFADLRGWRGWEHDCFFGWRAPEDRRSYGSESTPARLALTTVELTFPMPADQLPTPRSGQPNLADALAAVGAIVAMLNTELRPVLWALDGLRTGATR